MNSVDSEVAEMEKYLLGASISEGSQSTSTYVLKVKDLRYIIYSVYRKLCDNVTGLALSDRYILKKITSYNVNTDGNVELSEKENNLYKTFSLMDNLLDSHKIVDKCTYQISAVRGLDEDSTSDDGHNDGNGIDFQVCVDGVYSKEETVKFGNTLVNTLINEANSIICQLLFVNNSSTDLAWIHIQRVTSSTTSSKNTNQNLTEIASNTTAQETTSTTTEAKKNEKTFGNFTDNGDEQPTLKWENTNSNANTSGEKKTYNDPVYTLKTFPNLYHWSKLHPGKPTAKHFGNRKTLSANERADDKNPTKTMAFGPSSGKPNIIVIHYWGSRSSGTALERCSAVCRGFDTGGLSADFILYGDCVIQYNDNVLTLCSKSIKAKNSQVIAIETGPDYDKNRTSTCIINGVEVVDKAVTSDKAMDPGYYFSEKTLDTLVSFCKTLINSYGTIRYIVTHTHFSKGISLPKLVRGGKTHGDYCPGIRGWAAQRPGEQHTGGNEEWKSFLSRVVGENNVFIYNPSAPKNTDGTLRESSQLPTSLHYGLPFLDFFEGDAYGIVDGQLETGEKWEDQLNM